MAIFFSFKTQQSQDLRTQTLCSSWHPTMPLLAVAYENCNVSIYNEEGDRFEGGNINRGGYSAPCECLAWHPTHRLLITGWRDGNIVTWSDSESNPKEMGSVHSDNAVSIMTWNPSGTRLVTADKSGQVIVWKLDGKTRISNVRSYKLAGSVTHLAFRVLQGRKNDAREAIDQGDWAAEDLTAEEQGGGGGAFKSFNKDCTFYCGGSEGIVHMLDDTGNSVPCINASLESPLAALLYYANHDGVVCLTQSMVLALWYMTSNTNSGQVFNEIRRAKIASTATNSGAAPADNFPPQVMWVGTGLLVTANNESVLRLWNMEKDETYQLLLTEQEDEARKIGAERISCIAFNPRKRVLAGGTKEGRIVFWQFVGTSGDTSMSAEDWEAFAEIDLDTGIQALQWGPGESLLSANMPDSVSVLHETILKRRMVKGTAIIQLSPECVFVELLQSKITHTVRSGIRIKGLDLCGTHFAAWDGRMVEVYEITSDERIRALQHQEIQANSVSVHNDFIFVAKNTVVEVYDYRFNLKQTLSFLEQEGSPAHMDVHGDHLVVVTTTNFIKTWRIGSEAKQHGPAKQVFPANGTTEVTGVKCNCNGTKISMLAKVTKDGHTMTDTKLYVYDVDDDKLSWYDFNNVSRFPISHCWDETEQKLLGCETRRYRSDNSEVLEDGERASRIEVATLFASKEKGVVLQDSFPLDRNVTALIGLSVPNLYFYARFLPQQAQLGEGGDSESHIDIKPMSNFDGIPITDSSIRDALLNFSYYLSIGNMDEAYRSVKSIQDKSVWFNMAVMCVKTKRLDVAEVCLGKMNEALGARALREAKETEPQLEAQVAMLAIHLGQLEEAERLYRQCKRYDLLCRLMQSSGRWTQALQLAEQHDRIHLRTVHYNYARYLEALGDVEGATKEYESSRTHRFEVPRMLFDSHELNQLERYINKVQDKDLLIWWAQYNESNGQFDAALQYYELAEDKFNLVRVHCLLNNLDLASEIVQKGENPAAAYHLARQFEDQGEVENALKYFQMAKTYRHAINIAKSAQMDHEVMNLAMQANHKPTMIDAAQYFETRRAFDKAVMLYQKGGNLQRAIDLCVSGRLFDTLDLIADNLDVDSVGSEVFISCAKFFLENGKFDKACRMFINAKAYERALRLCSDNGVVLTSAMAEQMTLAKSETEDSEYDNYRTALLIKVAKVAKKQGDFHTACKKYTQANERVKAMKALLKSGDKDKIIFFAQHSRHKDIYVYAANFLQSLDWQTDNTIMAHIINFYTKARAYDRLATFFDACAQVEVDEERNYDKAKQALQESEKYWQKAKTPEAAEKLANLQTRINYVTRFLDARKLAKDDPNEMVRRCYELLEESDLDAAVRVGDLFAMLVELHYQRGDLKTAFELVEKMRDRSIQLHYYLDGGMIDAIYKAMGIDHGPQEGEAEEIIHDET